jgi:hypothetical protein
MSISSVNGYGMNPYIDLSNAKVVESEDRTDSDFSNQFKKNVINNVKSDIYEKFGINVGVADNSFECFISGDVLYRMNTDEELKEKIYAMLEDYTSPHFQMTKISLNPPVKKCTLVFDENGDVVATLYPDVEKEKGNRKRKSIKIINGNSINELLQMYGNADDQVLEKDLSDLMQIMATEYKRKNR